MITGSTIGVTAEARTETSTPAIFSATVSADQSTLFVDGVELGPDPAVTLGDVALTGVVVDAAGRRLSARLAASAAGNISAASDRRPIHGAVRGGCRDRWGRRALLGPRERQVRQARPVKRAGTGVLTGPGGTCWRRGPDWRNGTSGSCRTGGCAWTNGSNGTGWRGGTGGSKPDRPVPGTRGSDGTGRRGVDRRARWDRRAQHGTGGSERRAEGPAGHGRGLARRGPAEASAGAKARRDRQDLREPSDLRDL